MKTVIVTIMFCISTVWADLPECHPDYQEWLNVGMPESWGYPRQCRGDVDGLVENPGGIMMYRTYVYLNDLSLLTVSSHVPEPPFGPGIATIPNGLAADIDHRAAGSPYFGYYRVGTTDLCIMAQYYRILEPTKGPGIPVGCDECPYEGNGTEGPRLSLQVRTGEAFEDKEVVRVFAGTVLEIGIANSTSDKSKLYDGYVSITGGHENGAWTGASWLYEEVCEDHRIWTYFGAQTVPGMDTWYTWIVEPCITDDFPADVTSSVSYQYTGPGAVVITLLDEFFEPVDTLLIEGPLTVLSPNGGEVLTPGHSFDITWTGIEQIELVDIDYSLDNGGLWQPVVADANNNGLYVWNPIPVANSSQCLIRISDSGDPNVFDISDDPFEISECLSDDLGNYAEWVQFGRPDCWCYPYNCKGDADGTWEGSTKTGYKRVYLRDLDWLTRCYNISEPPKGPGVGSIPGCICADFDRAADGTSKTGMKRVYLLDLAILSTNYNVLEPTKGPGILPCPMAMSGGEIVYYKYPDPADWHTQP